MLSLPGDAIVAAPNTITGSIGVMRRTGRPRRPDRGPRSGHRARQKKSGCRRTRPSS